MNKVQRRCSLVVSLGSRGAAPGLEGGPPPSPSLLSTASSNTNLQTGIQGMPNQTLTATGPARVEMGAKRPQTQVFCHRPKSRGPTSAGARHRGRAAFPDHSPNPWPPAAQSCECGVRRVDTSVPSLPGTQPQGQKQPLGVTSPAAQLRTFPKLITVWADSAEAAPPRRGGKQSYRHRFQARQRGACPGAELEQGHRPSLQHPFRPRRTAPLRSALPTPAAPASLLAP